jgi:hypothetical protein
MNAPTHADIARDLGRVETLQEAMTDRMDRFEKLVTDGFDKLDSKLDKFSDRLAALEATEQKRSGAWSASEKVLASIGGVVLLIGGAVVSWISTHIGLK